MLDITKLSISEAKNRMAKKEFTSVELTNAFIKRAEEHKHLNAFVNIFPDVALKQAAESDKKIQNNEARLIEGIPIAIKDLFCTYNIETTACSKILEKFRPQYESTVTRNLRENGGVHFGKTNMDEFAMGSSNTNSVYGPVINPYRRKSNTTIDLVPGGSSGGSAVAVADNMSMGALGSDTGGSIRQPASFCGIVGVKPTYGRCSRYGMIAFASSLDQAGVFANSVEDAALILQSICGYDPKDSTSAALKVPNFNSEISKSIKGLKVGIPKEYCVDGINEEILKIWKEGEECLKNAGAEIIYINLPHTIYALPTYYIIASAEASSNLERYDGIKYGYRTSKNVNKLEDMIIETRSEGFGAEVKRRIMLGTYALSLKAYGEYYIKAQKVRKLIANDFVNAFKNVDVILTPTTPTEAFAIGEKIIDPITMYLNDVFTVPSSLAGVPAISVPATFTKKDGLPLGLQLIGRHYDEVTLFKFASILQNIL